MKTQEIKILNTKKQHNSLHGDCLFNGYNVDFIFFVKPNGMLVNYHIGVQTGVNWDKLLKTRTKDQSHLYYIGREIAKK